MILPPPLLHFQVNIALAYVSLTSVRPNFQTITISLSANDLPTNVIKKITLLDIRKVKKLKRIFGGPN